MSGFTPNAKDTIIDQATGQFTEIGRILIRRLTAAVGELAPTDAGYLVSHPAGALTGEVNLGALASGYLKLTTAIGIAAPSTVALIPQADVSGLVAALAVLTSGTYTPTLFAGANVAASTAYSAQYLRVGSVVTVSGRVDVDPTAATTLTVLGVSLPIASVLVNANECAGTGVAPTVAAQILGDVANARATLQFTTSADVSNQAIYWTFSYRLL